MNDKEVVETNKDSVSPGATAVAGPFPGPGRHESGDQTARNSRQSIATATLVQNECIVIAEPIEDVDDAPSDARTLPKKQVAIAFLLLSVVVVAIVCLVVVLPGRTTTKPTAVPDSNAEESSDALPSLLRREFVIEALADISEHGRETFDVESPFFSSDRMAALDWIVDIDPQQLPVPELEDDEITDDLLNNSTKAEMLRRLRQRYVAALFYFATNGDEWYEKFEFLSGFDECAWNSVVGLDENFYNEDSDDSVELKGIFCNKEGRILEFIFWWNNLSGTLPKEVGSTTQDLITINVGGSSISGTIPSSLTKLSNLKTLGLADSCFTGVIPQGLLSNRTMPNLNVLLLHNNVNLQQGYLNGFCNDSGTGKRQGIAAVSADCPADQQFNDNSTEGIVCDCCICCNRDVFECTDLEFGHSYNFMHKGLTADSVMYSSSIQCISSKQKQFIRDECSCIVEAGDSFFHRCTSNCTEEGATRLHKFGFD